MSAWLWFWFSVKRQFKRPGYLILLILLPLCLYVISGIEKEEEEGIPIALYVEGGSLAERTADTLIRENNTFHFYLSRSKEALERDVASGRAECGYVFYDGLEEKLEEARYEDSIGLCVSPATVAASLSTEVVFASLIEEYGRTLLKNCAVEELLPPELKDEGWEELETLFDLYLSNHSTFSFSYDTLDGGKIEDAAMSQGFPVRGVAAVMVFIAGLFGAVMVLEDEKKGLFLPVPYEKKVWCKASAVLAPVMLACASGLVCLAVTGNLKGIGYELAVMGIYGIASAAFACLLGAVVKQPDVVCCLIPFFIVGSLILCPVFLDVGRWLPGVAAVQKLFLPYYYLRAF